MLDYRPNTRLHDLHLQ